MRNLKRALSLAVASVMLLGMMVVGTGAASYGDVDAQDNLEAIEVLQAVGIMTGDDQGNFNPDQLVTRGEMAVVMCKLLGLTPGGSHPFVDVPDWANGYVAACYANGITGGTSATTYGTDEPVTAVQAALMVMKPLGYFGYQGEFGDSWELATVKQANEIDLYAGLSVYTNQALTRNDVAQMVLNALECDVMIVREEGGMSVDGNGISVNVKPTYDKTPAENNSGKHYEVGFSDTVMQLCEKLYGNDLRKNTDTVDDYGRPSTQWTYHTETIKSPEAPALVYTDEVKVKDIYADLGKPSNAAVKDTASTPAAGKIVIDGQQGQQDNSSADITTLSSNSNKVGGKGTVTEVYFDKNSGEINIVCINTYLAQASADYNEEDEELDITVYATGKTFNDGDPLSADDFDIAGYQDEDYILVTAHTTNGTAYTIDTIAPAEVVEQVKVSAHKAGEYVTAGGTEYEYNAVAKKAGSGAVGQSLMVGSYSLQNTEYNLILDSYGYVIGVETYSSKTDLSNYLFVTDFAQSGFDWMAKVVFMDGSKDTVVVAKSAKAGGTLTAIAGEDGEATANTALTADGKVAEGRFYTFDVNKDDEYELTEVADAYNRFYDSTEVNGDKLAPISASPAKTANNSTVFIADGKVTTGVGNGPVIAAGNDAWVLCDPENADYLLVVFSKTAGSVTTDADELVYIYNTSSYATAEDEDENTYYIYDAIKNGEKVSLNVDGTVASDGLYVIGSYDDGYVDATYLKAADTANSGAAYKKASAVSAVTYTEGTVKVTGTGDSGYFKLADEVDIYTIDSTNNHAVKSISASYIKNLTIDGNETVYLVQESASDTDIVALYIVIA